MISNLLRSLLCVTCISLSAAGAADAGPTPVNQVFQYMASATTPTWSDGSSGVATTYLWIPERCQRLRGVLVLCFNVPEHLLVGHQAIRAACAANDLGIVWATPTFYHLDKDFWTKGTAAPEDGVHAVALLQTLLDKLARESGYAEVATVPWLGIGESSNMPMVETLSFVAPQRCIASIYVKNSFRIRNHQVPVLIAEGASMEWSQDTRKDLPETLAKAAKKYDQAGDSILGRRTADPAWGLSYLLEASGHFDCSEALTKALATYIDGICHLRLATDGSTGLRPLNLDQGVVADLPFPGRTAGEPVPHGSAGPEQRRAPWFPNATCAREAQSISAITWTATPQMPACTDDQGAIIPFSFRGIQQLTPTMAEDGITFTVGSRLLDTYPAHFAASGFALANSAGTPAVTWICGGLEPLGNGHFRIARDRTPDPSGYLIARQEGNGTINPAVQPISIRIAPNRVGTPQTITFPPLADVPHSASSIPLLASASSGLPVGYYVIAGPAIIREGNLVFTPIPPRSAYPVEITVAAWQWGRSAQPAVQQAPVVTRSFHLIR